MYLSNIRRSQILTFIPFLPFSDENPYDRVDDEIITYPDKTVADRLKNLFQVNSDSGLHPLLVSTAQIASTTFIAGGIYGGIKSSRSTFINFIENNEATLFRNQYQAKRQLSDKMFLSFARGFISMGTKISFFSTAFMFTYTISSIILNKNSIFNYSIGGSCAGTLYKSHLGIKGMISGGIFGAAFGTIYGTFKVLLLNIFKLTEQDLLQTRCELTESRNIVVAETKRKIVLENFEKELIQQMTK